MVIYKANTNSGHPYFKLKHTTNALKMGGNFSDVQCLIKTGQKPDSFTAHFEKHFKSITSCTDLYMCMMS